MAALTRNPAFFIIAAPCSVFRFIGTAGNAGEFFIVQS